MNEEKLIKILEEVNGPGTVYCTNKSFRLDWLFTVCDREVYALFEPICHLDDIVKIVRPNNEILWER